MGGVYTNHYKWLDKIIITSSDRRLTFDIFSIKQDQKRKMHEWIDHIKIYYMHLENTVHLMATLKNTANHIWLHLLTIEML